MRNKSGVFWLVLALAVIGGQWLSAPASAVAETAPAVSHARPAMAYTASSAVAYAEQWALSRNPAFKDYGYTDCTNFVSQSLLAGGFKMVNLLADSHSYWNWWSTGSSNSYSWSVAVDLLNFLYEDNPGGIFTAYWTHSPGQQSGTSPGGVIFYDWGIDQTNGGGEGISHSAIQVAYGTDPNTGWTGDLVDTHANDHKHGYWSLEPYNLSNSVYWSYTVVGISVRN